jgi:aspartate dehydrogenase
VAAAPARRIAQLLGHVSPLCTADAAARPATERKEPFQLGIIGLGAIGKDMLQLCISDAVLAAELHVPAVLVRRPRSEITASGTLITSDTEAFFAHRFDAVLEVAGHATVISHGRRVLDGGADFIVTSVGAFSAEEALLDSLREAAVRGGSRLVIPSAGIEAPDILSAGAVGGLTRWCARILAPGRTPSATRHSAPS